MICFLLLFILIFIDKIIKIDVDIFIAAGFCMVTAWDFANLLKAAAFIKCHSAGI